MDRSKSKPQFTLNEIIKVDGKVCDSCRARIAGREYGPDNKNLASEYTGWCYTLKEIQTDGSEKRYSALEQNGFYASEQELLKWGNLPNPVE